MYFLHVLSGCLTRTAAIVKSSLCQLSNPQGYDNNWPVISLNKTQQTLTTCLLLSMYCTHKITMYIHLVDFLQNAHIWHCTACWSVCYELASDQRVTFVNVAMLKHHVILDNVIFQVSVSFRKCRIVMHNVRNKGTYEKILKQLENVYSCFSIIQSTI